MGYGLSYTQFYYSNAKVNNNGDIITVTVNVKNIGKTTGKEVVELYEAAPNSKKINKPAKELKAFAKTKALKPGETEVVTLTVKTADLASFSEASSAWKIDAGIYQLLIGTSSRDIRATLSTHVKAQESPVHNVLAPQEPLNLLHR